MPSKIEKLIAKWRGKENHAVGNLAERFRCADELERAYLEEVLPLMEVLREVRLRIDDGTLQCNPEKDHEWLVPLVAVTDRIEKLLYHFEAPERPRTNKNPLVDDSNDIRYTGPKVNLRIKSPAETEQ